MRLWESMTGELPSDRHQQPKTGIFQDSGNVGNGSLTLKIEGNRIDILYLAAPTDPLSATFPDDFRVTLTHFSNYISKLLNRFHDFAINRIALGGTFWHHVNTTEDGNILLNEKLNLALNPASFLDFSYQINYPYTKNISDKNHTINQISAWTASTISFQPLLQNNLGFSMPVIEKKYIQVDIDINNKPTIDMLDENEYQSLSKEYFIRLAGIIDRGPNENVEPDLSTRN
jgi:hypothetical protein